MRALAHGIERAALAVDRVVGIALAEFAFRLAHGFAGAAELIHPAFALAFLVLPLLLAGIAETALAQLLEQLVEPVAQAPLILLQVAQLLLTLPALLALAVAPHILALFEGVVAQLLLLADHVAQFVERRHHVVFALLALRARAGGLKVLEHRLHLVE